MHNYRGKTRKFCLFFNSISTIVIIEFQKISEVKHIRRSKAFFTCLSFIKMLQLV